VLQIDLLFTRNGVSEFVERCVVVLPRRHPQTVDDAVNDGPATGFEEFLRIEDDLPGERVDGLVDLDAAELRVAESLVAEAGDEDPLQGVHPVFQSPRFLGIICLADLLLEFGSIVDDRLEHRRDEARFVADAVSKPGNVVGVVTVTPNRFRTEIVNTHDVRVERCEVDLDDVLASRRRVRLAELCSAVFSWKPTSGSKVKPPRSASWSVRIGLNDSVSHARHGTRTSHLEGPTNLDRGEDVADRPPRSLLEWFPRPLDEVEHSGRRPSPQRKLFDRSTMARPGTSYRAAE